MPLKCLSFIFYCLDLKMHILFNNVLDTCFILSNLIVLWNLLKIQYLLLFNVRKSNTYYSSGLLYFNWNLAHHFKVYNSLISSIFTKSCNHYHYLIPLYTSKSNIQLNYSLLHHHSKPWEAIILLSVILLILDISYEQNNALHGFSTWHFFHLAYIMFQCSSML
jgi:hypothetical protein